MITTETVTFITVDDDSEQAHPSKANYKVHTAQIECREDDQGDEKCITLVWCCDAELNSRRASPRKIDSFHLVQGH